ncbi:MAG: hypothetical protein V4542_02140 [Pseudomonadota bacterium]
MEGIQTCSKVDCKVAIDGICIEGNSPFRSCPFYGQPPIAATAVAKTTAPDQEEEQTGAEDEAEEHEASVPRTRLASGEPLTIDQAGKLLLKKSARFIAIVGELDSGKTTLIGSLYEKFLRGSYAGYRAGGSRTLVGLEKKSHHSRVDSGRKTPDTVRTSQHEGLHYFHFSLKPEGGDSAAVELLISDRAGELFEKARSNISRVPELLELKNADYVVILLDGARLADPLQRTGALQNVRQTIRAFLDGGALTTQSKVQIITTKIDRLSALKGDEDFQNHVSLFKEGLKTSFSGKLLELSFKEIAARDPTRVFELGHGIPELLPLWCEAKGAVQTILPIRITPRNEFDLLLTRTPQAKLL